MKTTVIRSMAAMAFWAVGGFLSATTASAAAQLPRLVDLGADKCIPCKMMKPVLDELRREYRGRLEVVFIDVWKNPKEAEKYGIQTIPTQIFYDGSGKERARHEGFFAKQDILAQWKQLGISLDDPKPEVGSAGPQVDELFPGLSSGALTFARLGPLPDEILLQAGKVIVTGAELQKKVDCASKQDREQYKKNRFFLLEQEATNKLLLSLARSEFARTKTDCAGQTDPELIRKFIQDTVAAKVSVSDVEVIDYYEANKEMCGGATFVEARNELKEYALEAKRQKVTREYIRTLGQRVPIVVSAAWVKDQAKLTRDNPVDQARASGKPSVVDFGAVGCRPCDMMTPVLKALKEKYAGKVNVLFVHVRQENILAARYGVETIPIQVFFDKNGKEVYRHLGYFPQDQIELKLRQMGVK